MQLPSSSSARNDSGNACVAAQRVHETARESAVKGTRVTLSQVLQKYVTFMPNRELNIRAYFTLSLQRVQDVIC